jgi:hypothetical protein
MGIWLSFFKKLFKRDPQLYAREQSQGKHLSPEIRLGAENFKAYFIHEKRNARESKSMIPQVHEG